jgi:tetratricopeptide (TPR) repeat protein
MMKNNFLQKSFCLIDKPGSALGNMTVFIFFIFFMLTLKGYPQQPNYDFKLVDRETYSQFLNSNWDSLIFTGNKALTNGTDYFYLRFRIGIAYFNKGNYLKASQHLKKSLGFNSKYEFALEYLYYSYLSVNRSTEAMALTSNFSDRLNQKLNTKKIRLIDYFYFEPGLTFSNNIDDNKKDNLNFQIGRGKGNTIKEEQVLYGQQDLNDDKYFFNIGTGLNLSRKVSAYVSYGFLATSKLKQIQTSDLVVIGDTLIPWNDGYFVGQKYDTITEFYSNPYSLYQNEAYANAQIDTRKGFVVTPAFHYLNVRFNSIFSNALITDFYLQQIDSVPVKRTEYVVSENDTSFNNYVASLSVAKTLSLFNFSLNGTWSNLNNKEQYQAGGSVIYFPKGNLDIYTTTAVVYLRENKINRFILEQQVGFKIMNKLWVEGFVTLGEMVNYNEKNGFVVYNSGDKIKFRAGTNFIIILSKNIELSFRYRYTDEEGTLIRYSAQTYEETILKYQNNTLTGGIKWKL